MHSHVPLTPVTLLERSARSYPKSCALVHSGGEVSFSELLHRSRCLAQVLLRLKVEHGDRVAVLSENNIQTVEAHFAVPGAGAVLVMLNPWLSESDVLNLLYFSEAKVLIVEAALYQKLTEVNRRRLEQVLRVLVINLPGAPSESGVLDYAAYIAAADGSLLLDRQVVSEVDAIAINFTSGTTGHPKGVIYSHRAGYLHTLGQVLMLDLNRHSKYLWTLPMFHVNGWGHMWACIATGCTQVIPKIELTQHPADGFMALVREQGITHLAGAPRLVKLLTDIPDAQDALRGITIMTGGSAPSPTLIQQLENRGVNLIHQYGLNETCGPFVVCEKQEEWRAHTPETQAKLHARQGTAAIHAGTGLQVLDTNGQAVPHDGCTLGEVVMAGNTLALGYYKNPEATQQAFRGGWFYSGDMAVVHPDGYLEIRDRIKDLIYVETEYGWENISSIEIENVLCRHSAIQDAAVLGVVHSIGESNSLQLIAVIEIQPGARLTEAEFHAYCSATLNIYQRPQAVLFATLPKTNTGKVRKELLHRMVQQQSVDEINLPSHGAQPAKEFVDSR